MNSARRSTSRSKKTATRKIDHSKRSKKRVRQSSRRKYSKNTGQSFKLSSKILRVLLAVFLVGLACFLIYSFALPAVILPAERPEYIVIGSQTASDSESAVFLVRLSPDVENSDVYLIRGESKVPVIGGYGEYPLKSVYPLLTLENKDSVFMHAVFSHIFQTLITDTVGFSNLTTQNMSDKIGTESLIESVKAFPNFKQMKTYLQLHYLFKTTQAVTTLSSPLEIDAVQTAISDEPPISSEDSGNCQLAVVNTTQQSGLATTVSEILEHAGGLVVRITDETTGRSQSQISYIPNESCIAILPQVKALFPQEVQLIEDSVMTQRYRASMVLFLGTDLSE